MYKLFRMLASSLSLITILFLFASTINAKELKLIKEKTFSVKEWQNLYTEASGADFKVESWDKQEVYIKIFANQKAEEKLNFYVDQESDVVKVIIKKKGSFWNFMGMSNLQVRVEAFVPKNFNADLNTSGGDIKVYNITGGFKFSTSGGDIVSSNLNGKLLAETSGGDITLNTHKGDMRLSTSGGDIKCKATNGELKAETSGGDIDLDVADGRVFAETSGGDIYIQYNGDNKGIEASTSGGDVKVVLPSTFKADADCETTGGDIDLNFSNTNTSKVSRGHLRAKLNGGGAKLILDTTGGDITINQK